MNKVFVIMIFLGLLLAIDWYVYQGATLALKNASTLTQSIVRYSYWGITIITFSIILIYNFGNPYWMQGTSRNMIFTGIFINYFSKLFSVVLLLSGDLVRAGQWIVSLFQNPEPSNIGQTIPRSEFLAKVAMASAAIPFGAFTYGIISGAHDYRVKRLTVNLPNLPKSFDGIRIGQISDIHTGSFFNKTAVNGGVEMMLGEKPDLIFFTGDLVNNKASEVSEYFDVFKKLRAPYGVYSVTGNHDYGDYHSWESATAKSRNFEDLIRAHKELGFDLLMNENRILEQGGDKLAIIGNENWGAGRFSKYGKLDLAYRGTEDAATKLLLSHDPSHWDAQVRKEFPDIDLMFAGHTHGFQFGVEIGGFKWSPSQYIYKQWAGLYSENNQHLYVNRGFGFLGYPGRVGIPPELTVIQLKRA
ncbi:MAG: metallophosphoesterase [Cyclobacteriaceae bacterium]